MLCEKCKKNEASVFYRENINGKERKYSLCPECAAELEKNGEIKFSAFPHLSDMNDFCPLRRFRIAQFDLRKPVLSGEQKKRKDFIRQEMPALRSDVQ